MVYNTTVNYKEQPLMNKIKSIILAVMMAALLVFAVGCEASAYDIAVQNGFEGTEAEWLLSLKGKDGVDGKNGKDGKDGTSITINDVYDEAVKNGFKGSLSDFLFEYLSFEEAVDNAGGINKGLRSAVLINCAFTNAKPGFMEPDSFSQSGAGVIYTLNSTAGSAYIITNFHVVYSMKSSTENGVSDTITVTPYGGSAISAYYVGGSSQYDIAVLKATDEYFSSEIPLAVTVASGEAAVGQAAIAIGNPAGYGISATEGIVSVDSETIPMTDIETESSYVNMRVMRIDTPVNSGNSGGGLFDTSGNLIGIVNAKASDTSIENMAYAIPTSIAIRVADNIIEDGVFQKGVLGITVYSTDSSAYIDEHGNMKIREKVTVNSAEGASAGKLEQNDVLVSITVDGVTYSYTVEDEGVLSVDENGRFTGLKAGQTTVQVQASW
ncbi:MAG: trypsin-like serine protease, partial [Clostridiales bacterium]|nr:trypsin-like serine protease [Clostridiales bacterium]